MGSVINKVYAAMAAVKGFIAPNDPGMVKSGNPTLKI